MDGSYFIIMIFSFTALCLSVGMLLAKSLISSIIVSGVFSLCSMFVYGLLKAPDVAITEAAVGSAISTIILLITTAIVGKYNTKLSITKRHSLNIITFNTFAIIAVFALSIILSYIFYQLPEFGNPQNNVHNNISAHYLSHTINEFAIPNIVTAILGGYRGFDTMLETVVILSASLGVFSILNNKN